MRLHAERLAVLGGFGIVEGESGFPSGTRSILMIGLAEPGFWPHFTASDEWRDGAADPMDRWSRRVLGGIARNIGATALFPFGGPSWLPFYSWALRTGRIHESPVRLLVHADQGLMVSFRGALALREEIALPAPAASVCDSCADRPCVTACPVSALSPAGYDVAACHAHLDRPQGAACVTGGCLARRACPVSAAYARLPEHSAYHMRQFHK
ncbi:MAG: ferredoxin [Pseudorhodobacter sp.]